MVITFFKHSYLLSLLSTVLGLPDNVLRFTPSVIADLNTYTNATASSAQFYVYNDAFLSILGDNPTLSIALNSSNSSFPQFHEAMIVASTNPPTLFITSNQYNYTGISSPSTSNKAVEIPRVICQNSTWTSEIINPSGPTIVLPNGGTIFTSPQNTTTITNSSSGSIILLAQGSLDLPGGLHTLSSLPPYTTTPLLNSYHGTPFNSPNDVVQHSDSSLWFTDPPFGFLQSIHPAPLLPPSIYRYEPLTGDLRVVIDGLDAPNGIAFSPDQKTVYITDTGKGATELDGTRGIYAFDVVNGTQVGNRRVFAVLATGVADGIKTGKARNVYAGCGDGVNVWDVSGRLLGKVLVAGGAANFVLLEGMMVVLGEMRLWVAMLGGLSV